MLLFDERDTEPYVIDKSMLTVAPRWPGEKKQQLSADIANPWHSKKIGTTSVALHPTKKKKENERETKQLRTCVRGT